MRYAIAQSNRLGNRKANQDRTGYVERGDSVLLLLADGMGGYAGGELAAATFVSRVSKLFSEATLPIKDPKKFMLTAFTFAHKAIMEQGKRANPPVQPRTTGVACLVQTGHVYWAHVGDSRCYLLRDNSVFARTRDHSVVEDLIKKGELSEKERDKHPKKNQVTRCLGGAEKMSKLSIGKGMDLEEDDILVLCSDGLWSPTPDQKFIDYLDPKKNLESVLGKLCEEAETATYPNSDNISVVSMHFINNKPSMQQAMEKNNKKVDDLGLTKDTTQANLLADEIQQALDRLNEPKD